ncbi:MAG: GGDEF domain-containing protein [Nocardioidaceae bacterium]|nr:GGDEF domain-containing protein [Nocardioidaceae bacterium]NUS50499.1 GGDEF domain-containing protein [Nocardioidaceae bacterium]
MSAARPTPPEFGPDRATRRRSVYRAAPFPVQLLIGAAVAAAVVLPVVLRDHGVTATKNDPLPTLLCLLLLSVLNVELGRLAEGGVPSSHRPHKALSAWSFVAALLLPTPYLLVVVPFSYLHARWRGIRVPLWKWVGSAAYVVLAGLAAALVGRQVLVDPNLMYGDGRWGLVEVLLTAAVFLAVETVLFHAVAYLNIADDEVWLRRTLAGRSFYVTEATVLLMGGLSAAVWTAGAWFLFLLVPVYALAQRAALSDTLRERAATDDKTGLLRFESWRVLAVAEHERCRERARPWSVAFLDLDHFKAYNDRWGHLAGDSALAAVAGVLRSEVRSRDLVARFGGEEFCVFLPDTTHDEAAAIADRLRLAVATLDLPDSTDRSTISVGVVTVAPQPTPVEFVDALTAADAALFAAKMSGRNRVFTQPLAAGDRRPTRTPVVS